MRLIIVSNRLPVNIVKTDSGHRYERSSGGLVSGLGAYVEQRSGKASPAVEILWVGWPGTAVDNEEQVRAEMLRDHGTHCVFLSEEVMSGFYEGFCNGTLWPLFHYFTSHASYEQAHWEQYVSVNQSFCDTLKAVIRPGDTVWIHDYHLMLLPGMIRKSFPELAIGFFLHIPFPSYEIFRLLPSAWRTEILRGLYGADLIGFHTHDYRTYFLRSTLRILGHTNHMGEVLAGNHFVRVDDFPMGIDFHLFSTAIQKPEVRRQEEELKHTFAAVKIILSIDRQDYTKGILNRLKGFESFLSAHPEWEEKISLVMIVVPSRIGVKDYQETKRKIDELTGRINGTYGSLHWIPVIYQYRSLSFSELVALYHLSHVALVTPLRDGMNLVAKEFVATRADDDGVLILSEMAGAADELSESIIINPNNIGEIGEAIGRAVGMDGAEQARRMRTMRRRIRDYDVFRWADDFLDSLERVKERQQMLRARILPAAERKTLLNQFQKARHRTLILDYDGTLIPIADRPEGAQPDRDLLLLLQRLSGLRDIQVVILSGRDRPTLDHWFSTLPIHLVAEHGLLIKEVRKKWRLLKPVRRQWKRKILPILSAYVEKLPGSFVEEKEYSLVFHYRKASAEPASFRVKELMDRLVNYTTNMDLQVQEGDKALEVRNAGVDKGLAAMQFISDKGRQSDFILAIGDDRTDEDLFRALPQEAFSIKVGMQPSYARFNLPDTAAVHELLNGLPADDAGVEKRTPISAMI